MVNLDIGQSQRHSANNSFDICNLLSYLDGLRLVDSGVLQPSPYMKHHETNMTAATTLDGFI